MIVIDTNNLNDSYKCKLNPTIDFIFYKRIQSLINRMNLSKCQKLIYTHPLVSNLHCVLILYLTDTVLVVI